MLTVKQLKDWLNDYPEDCDVYADYYEKFNIIDLRIVVQRPGDMNTISTIGIME